MNKLSETLDEIPSSLRVPMLTVALIIASKNKDIPQDQYADYVKSAVNAVKIDASRVTVDTISSAFARFIKEDYESALEQMAGLLLAMGEATDQHRERELRVLSNLHELIHQEAKS